METSAPPVAETLEETAAASDAVIVRVHRVLTTTQAIVFSTRLRIRDSRELIMDANTLRTPAAHPVQSREGFFPSEMTSAA
jgi:hypothetical protein